MRESEIRLEAAPCLGWKEAVVDLAGKYQNRFGITPIPLWYQRSTPQRHCPEATGKS